MNRRAFMVQSSLLAGVSVFPELRPAADEGSKAPSLLAGKYNAGALARLLTPRDQWRPLPTAGERDNWRSLPEGLRRQLIETGARHLGRSWAALPASLFLEFQRNGNRSNYQRVRTGRRNQLRELVVAECVDAQGTLLDDLVDGIWSTCEETFWGVPAHMSLQEAGPGLPDPTEVVVDLFAAETASLLAWTDYVLAPALDAVSPHVRPRIRLEVERRVLTPCRTRSDFWWMGLDPRVTREMNNWTPWICSNWLTCALLLEPDADRRATAVHKILRCLDRFLAGYHEDGGCDEGPSYWGRAAASLFDCVELLHSASRGVIDFFTIPLVREMGRYIYRVHIRDRWFVNFADASARVDVDCDLVYRYGQRIGDTSMQAFGAALRDPKRAPANESIGRQLAAIFNYTTLSAAPAAAPLLRDVWLPGTQVMAARCRHGSPDGLYLAAKGGHNGESHNHNDVGSFIVYADGAPAIIDVGVGTYTAQTFSARRYEIWTMQSAYHTLPTIDGVMQAAGREFAARNVEHRADDSRSELRLDMAGAYPASAGLASWQRALRLDRTGNEVVVVDSYALKQAVGEITLTFMTPCPVDQRAPGELLLTSASFKSGAVRIFYDAAALRASVEEIDIDDERLRRSWPDRIYRILLTAER
ncbi:MAG: heparinase II/III domain-containing protein, partial [Vicinamibacteraceae bacterium]